MSIMTPSEFLSYWTDTNAHVDDEVARVMQLLTVREPGTARPKHFNWGQFSIKIEDTEFMELVAQKFRDAGWDAKIQNKKDMSGSHQSLVLKGGPVLDQMPSAPRNEWGD
jgi:hypothetical protein